jgi:hypothetical protein
MNTAMTRHQPDRVSLVFGVLFLAVAAVWLVDRVVDIELANVGWVAAAALATIGVLGLWHTLRPFGPARRPPGRAVDST